MLEPASRRTDQLLASACATAQIVGDCRGGSAVFRFVPAGLLCEPMGTSSIGTLATTALRRAGLRCAARTIADVPVERAIELLGPVPVVRSRRRQYRFAVRIPSYLPALVVDQVVVVFAHEYEILDVGRPPMAPESDVVRLAS